MRSIYFSIMSILLLLFAIPSHAQTPTTDITFYAKDGSIIQIAVNQRSYQGKSSSQITIGRIPGKRPYVEVFKLGENRGNRNYMQRVFSGTLKVERGERYWAEVDTDKRTIKLMRKDEYEEQYYEPMENIGDEMEGNYNQVQEADPVIVHPLAAELIKEMQEEIADEAKLQKVLNFKNQEWTVPSMVMIMKELLFDESRLRFLKTQNLSALTPNQIKQLQAVMTSEDAKATLEKGL